MHRWVVLVLALASCATGVTSGGSSDDDDGGSAGGAGSVGGGTSIGGASGGVGAAGGGVGMGGGPAGGGGFVGDLLWVNEIHYDNDGADSGEGVEIAGLAGVDLNQYGLELYNQGASYDVVPLSGVLPSQQSGFGAIWFPITGMQNGPNDGVALVVNATSEVLFFLGYGGASTATDGAAAGMTAVDIGVAETGTTPVGQSLQLTGTGHAYGNFTWTAPAAATPGQINTGQTIQ